MFWVPGRILKTDDQSAVLGVLDVSSHVACDAQTSAQMLRETWGLPFPATKGSSGGCWARHVLEDKENSTEKEESSKQKALTWE